MSEQTTPLDFVGLSLLIMAALGVYVIAAVYALSQLENPPARYRRNRKRACRGARRRTWYLRSRTTYRWSQHYMALLDIAEIMRRGTKARQPNSSEVELLVRVFDRASRLFPGEEGRDWFSQAYYFLTEGAPERRTRYMRSLVCSLPRSVLTAWWYLLSRRLSRRTAVALAALSALLVSGFTPRSAEPPAPPRALSPLATRLRNWFMP